MDWQNERWVKLYTRDTADDLVLSWQAQGLWPLLMRKADRAGVIATNHGARGIAALVRWPADVVTAALTELLEDGRIRECGTPAGYVLPNFLAAQDASSSDAQRKRDERERRSADANNSVTKRDAKVTKRDEMSRPSHAPSRSVTPRVDERRVDETRREEVCASPPAREPEEPWWGNPEPPAESPSKPKREPSGPHQTAIAAFDAYYRAEHGGSKPTWNGKTTKLMSALVKAHGLEEIVRRIRVLRDGPPKFPPAPWDMATFSQHFDKLAVTNHGRAETAVEVAYRIAMEGT